MTDQPKPTLWGPPDADWDGLHAEDGEAIASMIESCDELPETIVLCGYATKPVAIDEATLVNKLIERAYDWIDDNYGPDEPAVVDETNPSVQEAARAFVRAVIAAYPLVDFFEVTRETVNVREWVRENEPGWLEEA